MINVSGREKKTIARPKYNKKTIQYRGGKIRLSFHHFACVTLVIIII